MNKAGLHSSGEISKFYNFTKWNESKENVIYNHFDPTYGQCFTIDISPLIGKAGPNDIENKMSLHLFTKSYQNYSKYQIYLHNGSDTYALHENMPMIPFGGYMFGGFKLVIEKTIINSLPTKTYVCGRTYYQTCLKTTLVMDLKTNYNCYIPILNYDKNTEVCSNKIILQTIKTWIYHLETKSDFKDCKDLKPCQEIMYKIADKQQDFYHQWLLQVQFNNKLVTVVTDSYSYPFLSLFAELGGVIGMLLGLSVFGLFETVLEKVEQYGWKMTYLVNSVISKNLKKQRQKKEQKRVIRTEQNLQIQKESYSEELKILAREFRGMQQKITELEIKISKD